MDKKQKVIECNRYEDTDQQDAFAISYLYTFETEFQNSYAHYLDSLPPYKMLLSFAKWFNQNSTFMALLVGFPCQPIQFDQETDDEEDNQSIRRQNQATWNHAYSIAYTVCLYLRKHLRVY